MVGGGEEGTGREGSRVKPDARHRQQRRQVVGRRLAAPYDGVVRRADLLGEGLSDHDVRTEIDRGVWHRVGVHTISVEGTRLSGRGPMWRALWEAGPRAVLDGPTALLAAGLKGWEEAQVHVSLPNNASVRPFAGVVHHRLRDVGPVLTCELRRTRPEVAAIRAAQWARSDRAAATIVAMTVQQGLVRPETLLERWRGLRSSARRSLLDGVIDDVCDGAHSLNELDVAAACRRRGLPPPQHQAVRTGEGRRVYLDLLWEAEGVHAEIHGAHHQQGVAGVDDALRGNAIAIRNADVRISLQIPVLGWRLHPERFLDQIEQALDEARRRKP